MRNTKFGKGEEGNFTQSEKLVMQQGHMVANGGNGGTRKSTRRKQTNRNWENFVARDYYGNLFSP